MSTAWIWAVSQRFQHRPEAGSTSGNGSSMASDEPKTRAPTAILATPGFLARLALKTFLPWSRFKRQTGDRRLSFWSERIGICNLLKR